MKTISTEGQRKNGHSNQPVCPDYAAAPTSAQQAYELIQQFDSYCEKRGISYFAIDDTLIGCMVYGDFIPDESSEGDKPVTTAKRVQVGLLRHDFDWLVKGLSDDARAEGAGLKLEETLGQYAARIIAAPSNQANSEAQGGGEQSQEHVPQKPPSIAVSVFDALTDDYDLIRFQLFRIKKLARAANACKGSARAGLIKTIHNIAACYESMPHSQVANLVGGSDKPVEAVAVTTTEKRAFGPTELQVPADTSFWVESDKEAVAKRTKLVQQDSLKIMREIDRVCRENNIGYFICSGTLLGAIRHGGFIPWDDDIDIGMLRPDYNRFLECAQAQLGKGLFLQTHDTDPSVPYLFAKVRLDGTEYVTAYTEYREMHKGISVDIFPFDLAPLEKEEFVEHLREANRLIKAHTSLLARKVPKDMPHRRAKNPTEAIGHAVMTARHKRYWKRSSDETYNAYIAHVTKYNDTDAQYAVSYVESFTCIPLSALLPYQNLQFEGLSLSAPANPDPLLGMQFGDYLQLPPPHQCRGHRVVSWRTSTSEHGELN